MSTSRALTFIGRELREMIPPTLFFLVGFNIIVLTSHLFLEDYQLQLFNFLVATTSVLVVGKSVLLANALPMVGRFDGRPLIWPILFKTLIYFSVVLVVRLLEGLLEYWFGGGSVAGSLHYVEQHFFLASLRSHPDLDLRPVPHLHHGKRTERAGR